jgi:CheY-like chemotaxis protein
MAHILIADDDPIIADLLVRILIRCGHTTAVAGDGLAALCCLEQRPCDLLITDLEMPRFAGAALVRMLAARPQRPRILVASGSAIDIYDQLLGLPATDWNGRLKPLWDQMRAGQKAGQAHATATRQGDTGPSHPLSAYVGEYAHPGYGVIAIRMADEAGTALELVLNDTITLPLTHYHYDQFEAYWETWDGYQRLSFATDSSTYP